MPCFDKLLKDGSSTLNSAATLAGKFMMFYGVYSLGRLFIASVVHAGLGATQGLFIAAPPLDETVSKTMTDVCFDYVEETSVFLLRRSVASLREGVKGAFSGMSHESKAIVWPWCQFYKSATHRHETHAPQTTSALAAIASEENTIHAPDTAKCAQQNSADATDSSDWVDVVNEEPINVYSIYLRTDA